MYIQGLDATTWKISAFKDTASQLQLFALYYAQAYKTMAVLPFRIKRKVIMKILGPVTQFLYINTVMEIEATSITFTDRHHFSEPLTENLYSYPYIDKCIQNLLHFENLSLQ